MYQIFTYPITTNLCRWEIRRDGALLSCGTANTLAAAEYQAYMVVNAQQPRRSPAEASTDVLPVFRIAVHDNLRVLTFRLEGRLESPWAEELEKCWRTWVASARRPIIRVDLTGVTFIDDAGKARLAAMHEQGAEFIAGHCLTTTVVKETSRARSLNKNKDV
jgi:anti-anti-sigma regulatory factor